MLLVGSEVQGKGIMLFYLSLIRFAKKHIHILDFDNKNAFHLAVSGDKYLN